MLRRLDGRTDDLADVRLDAEGNLGRENRAPTRPSKMTSPTRRRLERRMANETGVNACSRSTISRTIDTRRRSAPRLNESGAVTDARRIVSRESEGPKIRLATSMCRSRQSPNPDREANVETRHRLPRYAFLIRLAEGRDSQSHTQFGRDPRAGNTD